VSKKELLINEIQELPDPRGHSSAPTCALCDEGESNFL